MKMTTVNIGIVGYGFVGKAIAHGFQRCNLTIIDPTLGNSTADLVNSDKKFEAIFVSVPTPMGTNGAIDTSIVEKVFQEISGLDTLIVLKSTVVPSVVEKLAQLYPNFVYNPEFLTEKNALRDFEFPFLHVYGGEAWATEKLEKIYVDHSICDRGAEVRRMTAKEASFVKYSINSYLALKVVFWNQMKELMESHGADYDVVRDAFTCDPRIGTSHSVVPGHDGRIGTGSACFSKDIPALIHFSDNQLSVLREAWNVNCDMRNSYGEVLPREAEQHITFNKI